MTTNQMEHAVEQIEAHANVHARKEFERLVLAHTETQLALNREHCRKIEQANRLKWFVYGVVAMWLTFVVLVTIYFAL